MVNSTRDGVVTICDLGDGENPLDPDRVGALHDVLDELGAADGPGALVTTGTGRFYSTGLVPDLFLEPGYLDSVQRLLARLLVSSTPTVVAAPGHVCAGGLLLALAHDHRVMRADRGYACLPEALLGFPFLPGMSALVGARLAPPTAHAAMVTAHRYDGPAAVEAGIIDQLADADRVLEAAVAKATELAPMRGDNLAGIKAGLYRDVVALLAEPALSRVGGGASR
ncbi:enoyl-CoA hydratase/isomerase family protein [Gordonia phthalatica]|uniref:Enoyl-CoA hydratase n=1 Tax=Gordonia phthalatica TaxID=1136941 RepID=A0A0N9NCT2_9ACTN|nr:enoyl-CoA hydratase/isomerase family protein [Gordonia phthalatica]ALG84889.1 hypothetical protein ACH46_10750 [Gordonia phthalatica]